MPILEKILEELPEGEIEQVTIGLRWTGVVVRVDGHRRCGLSSTLGGDRRHGGLPSIPDAGQLTALPSQRLAEFSLEKENPTLSSVGVAAINALLPDPDPERSIQGNADELLASMGAGKTVAIVGHFPFVPRIREVAAEFTAALQDLGGRNRDTESIRVFYQVSKRPLYTVGPDHYASELIALCGGRNVFEDVGELAPAIDVEAVVDRDPEVMLAGDDAGKDAFSEWDRWPSIAANRYGNRFLLPADELSRPTPRVVTAGAVICKSLQTARERRQERP